jgi:hypothetical protein
MSPAGKAAVLLGTFTLGFAAAWTMKPSTPPAPATSASHTAGHPSASKSVRPPKDGPDRQVAKLIKQLDEAGYDETKSSAILSDISSAAFLEVIQDYTRRAGVTGLDYDDQQKVQKLVAAWHAKDPGAALQWVLGLAKPKDRQEFLTQLIGDISKTDLDTALTLLREHGKEEDGGWNVPFYLVQELGKRDVATMLKSLGTFITSDGSSSGMGIEFSPGFDFRAALDGFAEIQAGLAKGQHLASIPSNLLAEWAKRDATAAWAWLQQGKEVPFNDVDVFFNGYTTIASPEEVAGLLVEAMALKSSSTEKFELAWHVLADQPNASKITHFLEQAPGGRDDTLRDLFAQSTRGSGGHFDEFKQLLLQQMNGSERSAVFTSRFKHGASPAEVSFYKPLLHQLGHSDEEISRMLPANQ